MSVLTIRELLAINGDSDVGVDGSVSHISTFAFTDKQTGSKRAESTSVTVITAAWKNGQRVVTDLTEMLI
jgi:hypothetical protein